MVDSDNEGWADVLVAVDQELGDLMRRLDPNDWHEPAAHVGWTCWQTVEHVAADFAHYAAQVVGQPRDHYVKFSFDTSRAQRVEELTEVVSVACGMLMAAVRTARPGTLGWHPHGLFTATGFAAIGAAEGLIHGADIAAGSGIPWSPPSTLCGRVCGAVFPDAQLSARPLETLLIETGRGPREDSGAVRRWNYTRAAAGPVDQRS